VLEVVAGVEVATMPLISPNRHIKAVVYRLGDASPHASVGRGYLCRLKLNTSRMEVQL
jgi:hypothetical protein